MKTIVIILSMFTGIALFTCNEKCKPKRIPDCICIQVYDPVCGCDGKTYSNSCEAECNSIYEYVPGECQ